jgi:hypothetical protein
MKKNKAHSFDCDLDLRALHVKLLDLGPWPWTERDSYYWGDYLSAKAAPKATRKVRIYEREGGGYQIDIFFDEDGPQANEAWESFYSDIAERLLPGIGAIDVKDCEIMN